MSIQQNKSTSINENGEQNIQPDSGYVGYNNLNINTNVPSNITTENNNIIISENGQYSIRPQTSNVMSQLTITTQTKKPTTTKSIFLETKGIVTILATTGLITALTLGFAPYSNSNGDCSEYYVTYGERRCEINNIVNHERDQTGSSAECFRREVGTTEITYNSATRTETFNCNCWRQTNTWNYYCDVVQTNLETRPTTYPWAMVDSLGLTITNLIGANEFTSTETIGGYYTQGSGPMFTNGNEIGKRITGTVPYCAQSTNRTLYVYKGNEMVARLEPNTTFYVACNSN